MKRGIWGTLLLLTFVFITALSFTAALQHATAADYIGTNTPPAAPSGLTLTGSGPDIILTWIDNSDNELGFLVERGPISGVWAEIGCANPDDTSFSDSLTTTGTYYYRVRAFNNFGTSDYTNAASYTLNIDYPADFDYIPTAPSDLTLTGSGSDVILRWTDNSDSEFGFSVEKKLSGNIWEQIGISSENVTSYSDRLSASKTYYYRIMAFNNFGHSTYSNEASYTFNTGSTASKTIALQIGNPYMTVNSNTEEIDPGRGTFPVIVDDRTVLPIRSIVETLGGTISWDESTRKVTIWDSGTTIELWVDNTTSYVNGSRKTMDVAPIIINGRTMVPIRFVVENMGASVDWDGAAETVTIRR